MHTSCGSFAENRAFSLTGVSVSWIVDEEGIKSCERDCAESRPASALSTKAFGSPRLLPSSALAPPLLSRTKVTLLHLMEGVAHGAHPRQQQFQGRRLCRTISSCQPISALVAPAVTNRPIFGGGRTGRN